MDANRHPGDIDRTRWSALADPSRRAGWRMAGPVLATLLALAGLGASGGGPSRDDDTLAARRTRIETMAPEERDRLLRSQERFSQLSPDEQARLRRLHDELARDPHAEQLRDVMHRYQEWLKTLPSSQRAELPKLSSAERIERIKKWQAEERKQARKRLALADVQALLAWREKRLLTALSPEERQRYEAIQNPRERRAQMRDYLDDPRTHSQLRQTSPADLDELKGRLSPEGRQVLAEAQAGGRDQVRRLLYLWDLQSRGGFEDLRMFDVKQEDLARFFDTLNDRDRDELLALPPDEMWQRLARRYMRDKASANFSGRRSGAGQGGSRGGRRGDDERSGPRNPGSERPKPADAPSRGQTPRA